MKDELTKIFGIEPVTEDLYRIALTHSSYTKDSGLPYTECYERLEFLGDAVLKLTMSDVLYKMYPEATEGELSKIRGIVVSDSTLAKVAKHDGLQDMIILSRHEEKPHIAENDSVCACAYEAILGAYYLDGKLEELIKYINKTFTPYITDVKDNFECYNAKAILQEYTQSKDGNRPEYTVVKESGPAHKRVFEVSVSYNGEVLATENGLSKKDAEQKCAFSACKNLRII